MQIVNNIYSYDNMYWNICYDSTREKLDWLCGELEAGEKVYDDPHKFIFNFIEEVHYGLEWSEVDLNDYIRFDLYWELVECGYLPEE